MFNSVSSGSPAGESLPAIVRVDVRYCIGPIMLEAYVRIFAFGQTDHGRMPWTVVG